MTQFDWEAGLSDAFELYGAGRHLEEVECVVADLAGMSRGKAMPSYKFTPATTFLEHLLLNV